MHTLEIGLHLRKKSISYSFGLTHHRASSANTKGSTNYMAALINNFEVSSVPDVLARYIHLLTPVDLDSGMHK